MEINANIGKEETLPHFLGVVGLKWSPSRWVPLTIEKFCHLIGSKFSRLNLEAAEPLDNIFLKPGSCLDLAGKALFGNFLKQFFFRKEFGLAKKILRNRAP